VIRLDHLIRGNGWSNAVRFAKTAGAGGTLLEEDERGPAGNNMPQVPGFAILIADARTTQVLPSVSPVLFSYQAKKPHQ
jgi:hypothetical protein